MTDLASKVAQRVEQTYKTISALNQRAATMASVESSATSWSEFANDLAEAEGRATVWVRLQRIVDYLNRNDMPLTKEALTEACYDMLTTGPDDGWSGRGNDMKRARFDGIRDEAKKVAWL
jgi:hypothetical protein